MVHERDGEEERGGGKVVVARESNSIVCPDDSIALFLYLVSTLTHSLALDS